MSKENHSVVEAIQQFYDYRQEVEQIFENHSENASDSQSEQMAVFVEYNIKQQESKLRLLLQMKLLTHEMADYRDTHDVKSYEEYPEDLRKYIDLTLEEMRDFGFTVS